MHTITLQRECSCGGECPDCRKEKKEVPGVVQDVLRSHGRPLDNDTRTFMESRFDHDFGSVRIHNDAKAAASAEAVSAKAYTVGNDIVFGSGRYQPDNAAGRKLLAHELTHVVQQQHAAVIQTAQMDMSTPGDAAEREADKIADAINTDCGPASVNVSQRTMMRVSRASLDIAAISADAIKNEVEDVATDMWFVRTIPVSKVYKKYAGYTSGEVAKAADYPKSFTPPTDMSKPLPADKLPDPDPAPVTPSNVPVEAHFLPAPYLAKGRALIIGGFHGDEYPGWQMVEGLIADLRNPNSGAHWFHTLIIPRLSAAAIQDEVGRVKIWNNRCNRQLVDLNRNLPVPGKTPSAQDCRNTTKAPIQPEVQAVMDIITTFKPDRIISAHSISNKNEAGIFADPNNDKASIELARGMARTLPNESDRPFNKLGPGPKDFNPVYPKDKPGVVGAGTSLGSWGPTAIPGKTTPVITIEAATDKPLKTGKATDARTVETYVRPLRAAIADPAEFAGLEDRYILNDIDAMTGAEQVGLLTGFASDKDQIMKRIRLRVQTAIAALNSMSPPDTITAKSELRLFAKNVGGASAQSKLVFEKLFLTGNMISEWDTFPATYRKADGTPNITAWLALPYKDRLDIILKYSALPGTSRHHWGTEVDFNSTTVADWEPKTGTKPEGTYYKLGLWLKANAEKAGFIQSYTAGRSGGYNEEQWHYSYAPIAKGLRERYNKIVKLDTDIIAKIVAEFKKRIKASSMTKTVKDGILKTFEADFEQALKQINILDYVNNINTQGL